MTERELARCIDQWAKEHEEELVRDLMRAVDCESVSRPGEGGYAMGTGCKECADLMLSLGEQYGDFGTYGRCSGGERVAL